MSRYAPSRRFVWAGLAVIAASAGAAWAAVGWPQALIAAIPLAMAGGASLCLGLSPVIELHSEHLRIGRRAIRWTDIRRVDRAFRGCPLMIRLSLVRGKPIFLVFAGDNDAAARLLRSIRRLSRLAMIEGRPYREFWGQVLPASSAPEAATPARSRLLLPEDEAEVERLYQQLRTAGRIDSRSSVDES